MGLGLISADKAAEIKKKAEAWKLKWAAKIITR